MGFTPSFPIGSVVTHQQLQTEFQCGNMGGMRRSHATNTLVIISDHTKSLYDDKWYGNELHYTGMGKNGDQKMASQNRTLAESNMNGVDVHLFEVLNPTQYIYQGIVTLCGAPYQETQPDETGADRKVWMFPLRTKKEATAVDKNAFASYVAAQEHKVKQLSTDDLKRQAEIRSSQKVSNRSVTARTYVRDPYVSEYAKRRAGGICQLCKQPAPFKDKSGEPYLETHHIEWLANGGADSIENTVALCPNCHRKMHVLNAAEDVQKLKNVNGKQYPDRSY